MKNFIENTAQNVSYSDQDSLVCAWVEFCQENDLYDDLIYTDLNELLELIATSYYEVACRVYYGNCNPTDRYFYADGYRNVISAQSVEDLPIDWNDEFASFIEKNYPTLNYLLTNEE